MSEITVSKFDTVDDCIDSITGEGGRIEIAPGLTVEAYLSLHDGALVVQIDTPAEGPHAEQHHRVRVYVNDAHATRWAI